MSELAETNFLELESSTKVIHNGYEPQSYTYMPVVPPIILSTTYKQPELGKNQVKIFIFLYPLYLLLYLKKGHEYSRISNPTRSIVESSIASLENGKYGLCFSSGLGAVTSVLFLLKTGDHILCIDDAYGGTNYLVRHLFNRMGIETSFADASNIDEFIACIRTQTMLVWIESPTNPTLKLCDLKLIKEKVYEKNSETLVVVDNTFATPCFQKPLDFGIDIVMESVTKYLNGLKI
jgi:cystathionine gamma-lyase